jgi:hypothetical protein
MGLDTLVRGPTAVAFGRKQMLSAQGRVLVRLQSAPWHLGAYRYGLKHGPLPLACSA